MDTLACRARNKIGCSFLRYFILSRLHSDSLRAANRSAIFCAASEGNSDAKQIAFAAKSRHNVSIHRSLICVVHSCNGGGSYHVHRLTGTEMFGQSEVALFNGIGACRHCDSRCRTAGTDVRDALCRSPNVVSGRTSQLISWARSNRGPCGPEARFLTNSWTPR